MIKNSTLYLALGLSLCSGLAANVATAATPRVATSHSATPGAATSNAFDTFAPLPTGWTASAAGLVGDSPNYYSLPETQAGDFGDDSWTYYTVHPVDLWRNALTGAANATNYTVDCMLRVERPATTHGFRGGQTFFNYQWGREAVGSDAAVIVRYSGPDNYYAVRLSTGFHHLELWKTHGGVVQVKPYPFAAGTAYRLTVTARGPWIKVAVDGRTLLNYCDTLDPLLHGQVGVGVRESRTAVTAFTVKAASPDATPAPQHKANFRVREWVGHKYIFDGDEPIAWFYFNSTEGMQLREMKLRPGLMPLVLPNIGVASFNFATGGTLAIGREGKTLTFHAEQKGKGDAFTCSADWDLSYQPGSGYLWDKRVHFVALQDKAEPNLQIDDPYFYQMVAPQTDKLPKARTLPNYCIFDRQDGNLIAFPSAHHLWTDGLGNSRAAVIRSGGSAVPTIDGWGVALGMPTDNSRLNSVGFCHWGLDLHVTIEGNPAMKKGETYDGHMTYSLWDRARVQNELKRGMLPTPTKPNPTLFNNIEPVNHLSNLSPGLTGESVRLWTGNYTVDRTTGHNDSICMRIDAKDIKNRLDGAYGDERPNIWQGPSYWTGPYLAPRYRFGMWVKADHFKGKVALLADGLNPAGSQVLDKLNGTAPTARDRGATNAELQIDGKCDWTYVSFIAKFPRDVYNWVLRVDPQGEGVVWVDDIEVTPLPAEQLASAAATTAPAGPAAPNG